MGPVQTPAHQEIPRREEVVPAVQVGDRARPSARCSGQLCLHRSHPCPLVPLRVVTPAWAARGGEGLAACPPPIASQWGPGSLSPGTKGAQAPPFSVPLDEGAARDPRRAQRVDPQVLWSGVQVTGVWWKPKVKPRGERLPSGRGSGAPGGCILEMSWGARDLPGGLELGWGR